MASEHLAGGPRPSRGRHAGTAQMPPRGEPIALEDSMVVTQYGIGGVFTDRLRERTGETEVSLILGQVDADAASLLVAKYLTPGRQVRHARVGGLRDRGFRVEHSPSKTNRLHVSVYPPGSESGDPVLWDEPLAELFNSCFTEVERGGGPDE